LRLTTRATGMAHLLEALRTRWIDVHQLTKRGCGAIMFDFY
jgi:hypothetical protein